VSTDTTGIGTRRTLAGSILAAAMVAAVLGMGAAPAAAAQIQCGERIKSDTKLTADLVNCPNNGIVIAADDVSVDLNGHRIDGDKKPVKHCPKGEICDVGILEGGRDGVTITGGKVRQFGFGVLAFKAERLRLRRLAARHNRFSGIVIVASTRAVLDRVVAAADGLNTDQSGMGAFDTDHLLLRDSKLRANGDIGLYDENLDDSRLIGNTFSRNHEAGVLLNGNGNVLAHNRFLHNGDGVGMGGNRNVVRRNLVTHSSGLGIGAQGGRHNVVAHNRVLGSKDFGISVSSYGPLADTVVRGNYIRGTGGDGLEVKTVRKALKRTHLRGNHVLDSGDDGIDVGNASTTLVGNHADGNRDLGIEAVRGVRDAGSNSARGNGDARECTHVACG
jgi:parallel beta-helix repeat protein